MPTLGIVGVGRIGTLHAGVLAAHPDVETLLISDGDQARAEAVAAQLRSADGVPAHASGDRSSPTPTTGSEAPAGSSPAAGGPAADVSAVPLDDLWRRADGVVIATPTSTHADLLIEAIRRRLPVFCEKPIALDVATTRRVVDAAHQAGSPVQIGFQRRFDAGYVRAHDAVRAGELGEPHRVHLLTCDPTPPPAAFIPHSGGLFLDCGIHDIDALRWVTGHEVVEVMAWGANRGEAFFAQAGDVDEATVLFRLDDDTLATLHLSRHNGAGSDVRMEIAGTLGSLAVGLDDRTALRSAEPGVSFPAGPPHPGFQTRFRAAYEAELRTFVDVVAGRAASPALVDDALAALGVCLACDLSRRENRPVRVAEVMEAEA